MSTMNDSASSPTASSRSIAASLLLLVPPSPPALPPMPALRLRVCTTSILCSERKRRAGPCATLLCGPRVSTAAQTTRATRTSSA